MKKIKKYEKSFYDKLESELDAIVNIIINEEKECYIHCDNDNTR